MTGNGKVLCRGLKSELLFLSDARQSCGKETQSKVVLNEKP
jgi:hypothetical protein